MAKGWGDGMVSWQVDAFSYNWMDRTMHVGLKSPYSEERVNLELASQAAIVVRDKLRAWSLLSWSVGVAVLASPPGTFPAWREEAE
jgi:hypothetical protein